MINDYFKNYLESAFCRLATKINFNDNIIIGVRPHDMLAHGYLPVSRIMALDKGDLTLLALKSTVVPWRAARGK